jgi:hypothetical protein
MPPPLPFRQPQEFSSHIRKRPIASVMVMFSMSVSCSSVPMIYVNLSVTELKNFSTILISSSFPPSARISATKVVIRMA